MYFKIIFTVLLCTYALSISAQKIEGTIKSEAGKGIPYVNLSLLNSAKGTSSDSEGNYSLTVPPGSYQVTVSTVGYATAVKEVTVTEGTARLDFTLARSTRSLDEVVITAQKREEKLIDVPLAVTSLSAKKVEDTRTWELKDLNSLIPNYYYGEIGVGFQQVQGIRGIQVFSENPAIATYIDGVNQLDILSNGLQLTDIERIEVLRGPQGTLFGRNAMGGVINIVTKKPTSKPSGFAELSMGNFGLQRYAAGVKAPLIKNHLYLGISALYQSKDGFMKNDTTGTVSPQASAHGKSVGDESSRYGNLYLKWLPSDKFDATLNLKGQVDRSDASSFFIYQETDALAKAEPDKVNLGRIGKHRRDVSNAALSLNYHTPDFTLSSTTSYQVVGLSFEDTYASGGILYSSYHEKKLGVRPSPQKVFTQELKIHSSDAGAPLQYTAGLFHFSQTAFEPTTNIATDYGIKKGPLYLGPLYVPGTYLISDNKGKNQGLAAYGQLSYQLTDRVSVTGGLRYDYEERENTFNSFGSRIYRDGKETELAASDTTVSADFKALSPKLSFSYHFSKSSHIYVSYTRGFRAGGANMQRLKDCELTYDPEFSDNVEVGYKHSFLEKKLFLVTNAYHIDWKDMQFFTQVAPSVFLIDNVGHATSYGLEIELSAIPVKQLRFDFAYGTNTSEYKDFELNSGLKTSKLGGNRLANTPTSTLFTAVQYDLSLGGDFGTMARLEWRRIGTLYSDRENDLKIDPYGLINARLEFSYRDKLSLALWGRNLSDERYIAYASPSTVNGSRNALSSSPRTYGLTLSTKF